jgi:hypothetical protein
MLIWIPVIEVTTDSAPAVATTLSAGVDTRVTVDHQYGEKYGPSKDEFSVVRNDMSEILDPRTDKWVSIPASSKEKKEILNQIVLQIYEIICSSVPQGRFGRVLQHYSKGAMGHCVHSRRDESHGGYPV